MVKLAVGVLVAVAGAVGVAQGAATQEFSGSIATASDVDLFTVCAVAGESIALSIRGASTSSLTPFQASLVLVDPSGAAMPSLTHVWRAPRTGPYGLRVGGGGGTTGDYVVSVAVDGGGQANEPANLSVLQSGAPDPVLAGELLTYTITVHNDGPGVAEYAEVLDPLPVATVFSGISWTGPEANWECATPAVGTNGKVSCVNKCFEPGGSVTFTLVSRVDVCAGDRQLTNLVTVAASAVDPVPGDNVTAVTSTVADPRTCDDDNMCTVGDGCAPGTLLEEDFDDVAPRTLPPGWIARLIVAPPTVTTGWRTGTGVVDTAPIAVFAPDAPDIRDMVLDSPVIRILTPAAQVIFRNRYDLERNQDGGVLEMKIGNGPFLDILAIDGRFESGGYDGRIRLDLQSPIAGRDAWTGDSGGFVLTVVDLPSAAVGQDVVLRWRMATDFAQGNVGQWIDSIVVTGPDVCRAGALAACDDGEPCTFDSCDARDGCRHAAVSCNDGNPCTDDACDAQAQCVHVNRTSGCDDHDVCTQSDFCIAGTCIGATPMQCTAADSCSSAGCDETSGCFTASGNMDASGFSAGRVDGRDVVVIARSWNSCPGDFRYDAAANLEPGSPCVDLNDFHRFMNVFGRICTP